MRFTTSRRAFLATGAAAAAAGALPFRSVRAAEAFAMQAAWINDAEFTGYFAAIDNGWYAEEGIELEYLSGGPDVIPESALLSGRAPMALTTPDTTIKAIVDQGAPFKIVGTQYQKNPIGIISLAKAPILSPAELVGKTLAVPPVNTISVNAMLQMNGIDPASVRIVPYAYDPTPLIAGEIDASMDFTTNVPFTIQQAGEEAVSFLLYDFGFTIYNDTVVVTQEALETQRELIVKWLRASRRGWAENLADPAKYPPMFAETWFAGTGRSIENEVFFNTAQKPLIEHPDGVFAMDEAGIEGNVKALNAIGIAATADMFDTSLLAEV
jgi:ABC-type nitrate/sulfonate/bicarbonate transport system substrate-binding protein